MQAVAKLRGLLFVVILLAIALNVLVSILERFLPFLIIALLLVIVGGSIFYRRWRW